MNQGKRVPLKTILAIISVGLISFIGVLMTTAMNVNFPELMQTFHLPLSTIQWITTGYMIVSACTMMCSSYINKRFTFRATFLAGAGYLLYRLVY